MSVRLARGKSPPLRVGESNVVRSAFVETPDLAQRSSHILTALPASLKLQQLIPSGLVIPLLGTRRFAATEKGLLGHWYRDFVPNVSDESQSLYSRETHCDRFLQYRILAPEACPLGSFGAIFDSVSLTAPQYLGWLAAQIRARGVQIERSSLLSLDEAFASFGGVDLVVNATGLGALLPLHASL